MEKMDQIKQLDRELEQPADFTSPEILYQDLIDSIHRYHPSDDISMVEKAYRLAYDAHKEQKRKSGEPYIGTESPHRPEPQASAPDPAASSDT